MASTASAVRFIEHSSFDAFNEAPHLKTVVYQHQQNFGTCKQIGADQIFATNANRKFCTQQSIATCFVPKGRKSKDEDQREVLRKIIANLRATVLEGSFGNENRIAEAKSLQFTTYQSSHSTYWKKVRTADAGALWA